jgi:hypothetical protein
MLKSNGVSGYWVKSQSSIPTLQYFNTGHVTTRINFSIFNFSHFTLVT